MKYEISEIRRCMQNRKVPGPNLNVRSADLWIKSVISRVVKLVLERLPYCLWPKVGLGATK